MISKNKINQVSREFKKIEDKYLMGIIYNTFLKDIRVGMIIPDTLVNDDVVIFNYKDNAKTIKDISTIVENRIKS